jgi:cytochrome c oxidase assembly factor CtaG
VVLVDARGRSGPGATPRSSGSGSSRRRSSAATSSRTAAPAGRSTDGSPAGSSPACWRWCVVSEWPIGQLGVGYLATVGIARYVVYTFVAAPLLVAGLPTWLIDRWFPLDSRRGRALSVLTWWPVALLLFNLVLFGTHVPITIDTLKVTQLGSFAVDVLHLSAAVLWWWPAIRREPERNAIHEPIRAFYLFATSVLMFVPAAFLTFSPLPLYGLYELAPPLWLGFDPVVDQQAAGITMNVVGGLVLWGIIATLFLRWAKEQADDDEQTRRARDARVLQRMAALADEERSATARPEEPTGRPTRPALTRDGPAPPVAAGPAQGISVRRRGAPAPAACRPRSRRSAGDAAPPPG